jgi:hypothetical protein
MPNLFAHTIFLTWPLIAVYLSKKIKDDRVLAVVLLIVPYLILPQKTWIDLPLVPLVDKKALAAIVAIVILYKRSSAFKTLPMNNSVRRLLVLLLILPFFTYLTNRETLVFGKLIMPGLGLWDSINMIFYHITGIITPFIIGLSFIRTESDHKIFLKVFLGSALFYCMPVLWEVRMSPQLHADIYGFFPHSFAQQMRMGGFRPVVFLGHGLLVAMFICLAFLSSIILTKSKDLKKPILTVLFLLVVLYLCKTWAAMIYGVVFGAILLIGGHKVRFKVAILLASVFMLLPMLRAMDLIPTEAIVSKFAVYSEERASSLGYRFDNEEILLDKANTKSIFGWGGWGRNRVYDTRTGEDLSTTDGVWIIVYGVKGWAGYIATFGLLFIPILLIYRKSKMKASTYNFQYSSGIALLLAVNLIDLIPNSSLTSITFLMAGALIGRLESDDS